MKTEISTEVEIPEKTEVKIDGSTVSVKGEKGEIKRKLLNKKLDMEVKDNKVVLSAKGATQREKRIMFAFESHIKNMVHGVNSPFSYTLKVCSSHFPMTVTVDNGVFKVKNFLGESKPRTLNLKEGVTVKIEGDSIKVESPDKELAGLTAGAIEQVCRITNRDRRIFQDGIFIIEKPKRLIEENE